MNKNTFWILIATFLIVAFGLGFFSGVMVQNRTPSYVDNGNQVGGYPLITEVIKAISSNYVKTVTEKDLAKSMLFGLDPYSTYFTPEEYQTFRNDTEGKYGGIGVVIELDETRRHVRVNQVFSPSPAFESGVD
jgi:carboxyl-terminal processing protease